jgi:hypothetical protein
MKNLTPGAIHIERQNGTRVSLPPCDNPPTIKEMPGHVFGYLGGLEIVKEGYKEVDLHGLTSDSEEQLFIVTREVFDALPFYATEFVTPDLASAVVNGLGIAHVIRRFIAKPAMQAVPEKPFVAKEQAA